MDRSTLPRLDHVPIQPCKTIILRAFQGTPSQKISAVAASHRFEAMDSEDNPCIFWGMSNRKVQLLPHGSEIGSYSPFNDDRIDSIRPHHEFAKKKTFLWVDFSDEGSSVDQAADCRAFHTNSKPATTYRSPSLSTLRSLAPIGSPLHVQLHKDPHFSLFYGLRSQK